ncbi:MAG: archaellin/type IV pilin N-terminal domain-containing protein, partial [Candidatus Caldarchaeum sp.]
MKGRSSVGLSPLVAVILLIAITVAAAVVVAGVFFNLSSIAGRRPTAIIDQIKLVATPAGAGTWAVVIKNTGDVPITDITASYPVAMCNPALTFDPLPTNPGATASAQASADTGCTLGTTFRIVLTVTFQDGSTQVLATAVTASIA